MKKSRREVNQQTKHRPRYLNDLKSFLTTHQGFKISLVILKILGEYWYILSKWSIFLNIMLDICTFWPPALTLAPQPNPNLYLAAPAFNLFLRPLLIKIGKNESQRLSIILLFYFYSHSFVTAIGWYSLLLFVFQVVVRYQFIIISSWWLCTCFKKANRSVL